MATYTITNVTELQAMSDHLADDCVLANDIDAAATFGWNERVGYKGTFHGFIPIGTSAAPFTGTFDGNGFTISNLYINRTSLNGSPTGYDYCGLFGYVKPAASGTTDIKDLNLFSVDITGGGFTGALAGYMIASAGTSVITVTNVRSSGSVKCVTGSIGGLVGYANGTDSLTFTNCSSSAAISRTTGALVTGAEVGIGGLVGEAKSGAIFASCTVSASINWLDTNAQTTKRHFGGFVGWSYACTFGNCIATGPLTIDQKTTHSTNIGGFVGAEGNAAGDYSECLAFGDCTGLTPTTTSSVIIGGFAGQFNGDADKCSAHGNIESACASFAEGGDANYSAGFVGLQQTGTISNSFARGDVCAEGGIGHAEAYIAGFGAFVSNATIENCFSAGEVYSTGSPTNGGGFCANDAASTFTRDYWDTDTSGWDTSDGGTGKTTIEMHTEATFTDWDFDDIWELTTITREAGSGGTIWLSKVGDFDVFKAGVNDADAFSIQLMTANTIRWMEALDNLVIGTSGDEWVMRSNKLDTPLTPNNWSVKQHTTYGSKNIQGLKVNETILFIDFVGRKLREMTYSYTNEKYVAPDLTALAEHITKTGVTSMAYQKNPEPMVWATLVDGTLIAVVYDREQNTIAWATYPIGGTDVVVQSVCVTPGTSEDRVTISVRRTINSASVTYIEEIASRTFDAIEDCFFVDSGVTVENSPASATLSGLDHLVGETVKVLGDGVEYTPTAVVNGSGEVTISTAVEKAQVGLASTMIVQPMRIVVDTQEGTSLGKTTRINEIVALFLDTGAAQYGASEDDMYDIDFTDERWVNNSEITGLFSGEVVLSMPGGFTSQNSIIIKTESPMPCTLAALVAKLDVTGR